MSPTLPALEKGICSLDLSEKDASPPKFGQPSPGTDEFPSHRGMQELQKDAGSKGTDLILSGPYIPPWGRVLCLLPKLLLGN